MYVLVIVVGCCCLLAGTERLSCRASQDETGTNDTSLDLVLGNGALHLSYEDAGSLLAHGPASLLDGREHRIAGHGTLAIGEPADRQVLGHTVAHPLGRIEDADGRIVVGGEERVGYLLAGEDVGGDTLRLFAVVAHEQQVVSSRQAVAHQGVMPPVIAISRFIGEL